MDLPVEYEYAGFRYIITAEYDQGRWIATPVEGQHKAAYKEKHRQAAISCFLDDSFDAR